MNLFDEFKTIQTGTAEGVSKSSLYPLMVWFSGAKCNLELCNKINKLFFRAKPEMLLNMLALGVNKKIPFLRYPKPTKEKDEILSVLEPHIKSIYGWGKTEWNLHKNMIKELSTNETFLTDLQNTVALEKKECKTLGIEYKKHKIDYKKTVVPKRDGKSLLSFA